MTLAPAQGSNTLLKCDSLEKLDVRLDQGADGGPSRRGELTGRDRRQDRARATQRSTQSQWEANRIRQDDPVEGVRYGRGKASTLPCRPGAPTLLPCGSDARIIADEGIASKAGRSEWQVAVDALIQHMRNGQVAEGFIAAIDRCGAMLAAHAPPADPPDELPDRIFVLS